VKTRPEPRQVASARPAARSDRRASSPPRPRKAFRPSGRVWLLSAAVLICLLALVGLVAFFQQRSAELVGPTVEGSPAAPDFALVDQSGQHVRLSDYRGKVVALTFLYTNCPDVCPLIATKLSEARRQLGPDGAGVELLAITVDPEHDTPAAVQAFNKEHQLDGSNWHYLLGSASDLRPVWSSYYVGTDAAQVPGSAAVANSGPSPDQVDHTAIIYLIDPRLHVRVAFDADFDVADLLHDVRALAAG
jgi:protein SCO1